MKTTKSTLTLVLCAFLMLTSTACSKSNEEKKEAAIAKIEKALNDKKFEKATEALNQIPSEFEADIEVYHCKIKAFEIKNNFDNVWTRYGKELAFRNKIAEMYPYVGVEYLLSELLKLECFHCDEDGDDYESHYQFHEYVDNYFQSDYDNYRVQPYNYCAEGWNHALQSIAILAAKNEDYATANRCLSEFRPIMKMVSRKYSRTTKYGDKQYNFTSKLVTSPTKEITIKKVQSVKMVKDIEREFNAANFSRGSSQLSNQAKVVLNKLVVLLSKDEALSVKFIGHTSADGDANYNQQLSKDRAKAAANYIESKGINYIRIGHEGKGSSELKNKYDPTSEENCRIEIVLL